MKKIQNELKNSISAGKTVLGVRLSNNGALGGLGKDNAFMIPVHMGMIGNFVNTIFDLLDDQILVDKGYKANLQSNKLRVRLGSGGERSGVYF